ncbi:MAG: RtcB family protein [Proteobacteria bacterium]|nr:RtcB family protein [Pseudomonadota bacterium]MBU1714679.1 RtcB family protein [Pseudomonadota bacterium]
MKETISSEQKPIKLWLSDIEAGALEQARNLANLPFVFHHIAIMPDAHQGYGMPIGGVMAAEEMIVPNAVGVDIGCGMCAVRTSLTEISKEKLKSIMALVRLAIPLGFKHHNRGQGQKRMPNGADELDIVRTEYQSALKQIGTLGGGNHFIEIQRGSDGYIWLMIHSGSRNIGFRVANHYNRLAISLNDKWKSKVPGKWQLAYLPMDSSAGQIYLREMQYCVEFAHANRILMMERLIDAVVNVCGPVFFEDEINIAHNYAAREKHFNKEVMVHRKGATRAFKDEYGIVPGCQGTMSYIVRGKGNPESFKSCSHGAGRQMGRKQAQRQLDLQKEMARLDALGVIHSIRSRRDLDEAAGAYKDISVVMASQADLVEIVTELRPLAVIKG